MGLTIDRCITQTTACLKLHGYNSNITATFSSPQAYRLLFALQSARELSLSIDYILPYGYETNHVSALISSSGSILVTRVKKTYPGFAILRGDEHQQVLQIIYMSGFVDYLQGEAAN